MSKIGSKFLNQAIEEILKGSQEKKRGFTETIDIQISLKGYDPRKDVRFNGSLRLPFNPRPNLKICVIGNEVHCDQARELGIEFRNMEQLGAFNRDAKEVKNFAKSFDAFLATDSLIKMIPRVLPGLNRTGKFPTPISTSDDLAKRVEEIQATIKFQLKKVTDLAGAVGHVNMTAEEINRNVTMTLNFLVSLLKKNWQNVDRVYIKSTMGKPVRLY